MKDREAKHIEDGFEGQQFVVLSETDRLRCAAHPVASHVYPLTFGYYPSAPGHRVHRREGKRGCTLICVLDGEGSLELDGQLFSISKNSVFVIPAYAGHTYEADGLYPWSTIWVRFEGRMEEHYRQLLGATLADPVLCMPQPGALSECLQETLLDP